jgi:short-subunit dehydrogenase
MDVKNKVAIVTGASSGIGEATAKLLTKKGAKVVLAARSKDKLIALSRTLSDSLVIQTDMTKAAQIKRMIKAILNKFGRVDILVNNAGIGYDAAIEKIDLKKFQYLINLDLIGPLIAMQEVIPIMRKQGGGAIINISSGTSFMNIPNLGAYSSLKRALNGFSLTAREELAKDKISVSVIYPYFTATNFAKNILGGARDIQPQNRDAKLPPADPPEYIAEKILEAINSGKAEIVAHDWMH